MSYRISIVYPFYNNHVMLAKQLDHIGSLSQSIIDAVEYIFVDDGSKSPINLDAPRFNAQVFRVRRDIKWNQDGARNIGAHHARGEWLLLADIDHIIPEETLREALTVEDDKIFTFRRVDKNGTTLRPHLNSFLMKKKRYWEIGGYDEDYRGTYGTDILWRRRLGEMTELPVPLISYTRDDIEDADTTNYARDYGRKTRLKWRAIGLWKRICGRGVRVLREKYDRIL